MKYEPKTDAGNRTTLFAHAFGFPFVSEVLADLTHAESVIAWQEKEIANLKEQLRLSCVDSCCTDDDVRAEAKKVLPSTYVDGNSHGVPDVTEIVCRLVSEVQRIKEQP